MDGNLFACPLCLAYQCKVIFEKQFPSKFHDPNDITTFVFPREDLLCILHCIGNIGDDMQVDEGQFRESVRNKLDSGDCNFAAVTFPYEMNDDFRGRSLVGANFSGATFRKRVSFEKTIFVDRCCFDYVDFEDTASFDEAWFRDGSSFRFENKIHKPPRVDFTNARLDKPSEVEFAGFDVSLTLFRGTDVRQAQFTGIRWPSRLFDEVWASDKEGCEYVGKLYRQLRTNFEKNGNYPDANRFYRGEMDMRRRAEWGRGFLPSLTTLYWLCSGYGLRPVRALLVTLVLLLLFSIGYACVGISKNPVTALEVPNKVELLGWPAIPIEKASSILYGGLHALQVLTLSKDTAFRPINWKGTLLVAFETIIIPIQGALFALAVRRKFQR